MKRQNLYSRKNKKNISICRLLKILPRVLLVLEAGELKNLTYLNTFSAPGLFLLLL